MRYGNGVRDHLIWSHGVAVLFAIVFIAIITIFFSLQAAQSSSLATVQTDHADNNFLDQATLHGQITATGGENCDQRGFDWRRQSDTDWQSWTESSGPYGPGSFTHAITALDSGTVYAFRAKAYNSAGWSYGNILTFRVIAKPTLQTEPATDITCNSATLNTKIIDNGGADLASLCFRYRKPGSYWTDLFQSGFFGPVIEFSDGFEDGTLSPFESKGSALWTVNGAEFYTGNYCAKSGATPDGEPSSLALEIKVANEESNLRFAYRVSSEKDSDYLIFLVDGVERYRWSGEVGWQEANIAISAGDHTLEWIYQKDDDGQRDGSDTAWVDDVGITSPRLYGMSATGLDAGATYEFFVIGTNYAGYTLGSILQFTTSTAAPTVSTGDAGSITWSGATLNGSIVAVNTPTACDERGFDWRKQGDTGWLSWTESPGPYGTGAYSKAVTGLAANTTYEVRAKAHNSVDWGYGDVKVFTTDAGQPPSVQADPATNITPNSATLNGTIVDTGGLTCDWRGFKYKRQVDSYWLSPDMEVGSFGPGPFSLDISGLVPGATYEFYCYAHNSRGFTISNTLTFFTQAAPTVVTEAASDVTAGSATLNGNVTDIGGVNCTERGFDWRRQGDADWQSWTESPGPYGTGAFSRAITGLSPYVTYEFKAKAHNSAGWSYGSTLTFTTLALPPIVTTDQATDVAEASATLNGSITNTGGQGCDTLTMEWRRFGETSWQYYSQQDFPGFGVGSHSYQIHPLEAGTTYEFRFEAHNSAGWTYGDIRTFTTLHPAIVQTDPATDITTSSAILHGEILDTGGWDSSVRGFYIREVGGTEWFGAGDENGAFPAGTFSGAATGLYPGHDYEFKAYANTPWTSDIGFGEVRTFRTAVPCTLQTDPPTNVASTSADIHGLILETGGENCDQRGFEWRRQGETSWLSWAESGDYSKDLQFSDGFEDGTMSPFGTGSLGYGPWTVVLPGAAGSAYCARSAAVSDNRKTYIRGPSYTGKRVSFNFKVSSEEGYDCLIFKIDDYKEVARWSGEQDWQRVTFDLDPGQHTFDWWYEKDGSVSQGSDCAWIDDVRIETPFDLHISGLDPSTTYEFRVRAHNSTGWSYGQTLTLSTGGTAVLDTDEATNEDSDSATLNGEIVNQGVGACLERGFDYRPAGQDSWQSWTEPGSFGAGQFGYVLSGLQPATGYSFRAKTHNSAGWSYGKTLTFETKAAPIMETNAATSVDHQSAVLNGVIASTGGLNCTERGFEWRRQGETDWQPWAESSGPYSSDRIFSNNFEDGTLGQFWNDSNVSDWNLIWRPETTESGAYTGAYCARSPVIPDAKMPSGSGVLSQIILSYVNIPGDNYRIRFARKVSSELNHDFLMFFIYTNNNPEPPGPLWPDPTGIWSGEVPWGTVSYAVPAGKNAFYWRYQKDVGHGGADAAWVDDVVIESTIPFSHKIDGLEMGTTYEFRSTAENEIDEGYGPVQTFKTAESSATQTDPAGSVTGSSARLNGRITNSGGENCDYRGFEWRRKGETVWQSWAESSGPYGTGSFSHDITGLNPNVTYEFKAEAHNSAGWSYGSTLTFTTLTIPPAVTTDPAGSVTSSSARLNGRITNSGGENCNRRGFEWRRQGETDWQSWMESGSFGTGQFGHVLSGLKPNAKYEFRAKAQNSAGWTKANPRDFETLAAPPSPKPPKPPEPPVSPKATWYLAEGSTAYGFETYISIINPNDSAVTAQITYMTGSGPVTAPDISLPAKSQATVNPGELLGNQDFSTKVVCREGKAIAVDRTMSWTGEGASSPEAHSSVGVTSPSKTWYLPEGSTNWNFETWLLIQNPNSDKATCKVTYMIEGKAPQEFVKEVPANSRESFSMFDDIGNKDASIKVEGNIPVIPERAMYRNNRREGHDSIGTTSPATEFYLAEGTSAYGFTTYVLMQNPNNEATDVTVTYMTGTGPKPQAPIRMDANSRKTIRVNDVPGMGSTDFSTQVKGSKPIIAERAMYWDNGTGEACHDSVGMASAHTSFYLPDGQTSEGRETYTLVQNPNSVPVTAEISYLTPTGEGNVVFTETVPANSRMTYNMADKGISGRAAIMVTSKTKDKKIMCERTMYWNSRGAGTDTIGGFSD